MTPSFSMTDLDLRKAGSLSVRSTIFAGCLALSMVMNIRCNARIRIIIFRPSKLRSYSIFPHNIPRPNVEILNSG